MRAENLGLEHIITLRAAGACARQVRTGVELTYLVIMRMRFAAAAAQLGQQNAEVLRDYLGYSAQRIERLEADGILYKGER